jgi:Flp pilus assembly protein TadD
MEEPNPSQAVNYRELSITELMDEASGDLAVGELEAAVEKYRQCIKLDPEFFDGWHALGMALMKTGHFIEAIEAGLKSTQLRPNDQLAWSSLSMFYVRNHEIAEAEAAGAKARILSWGGKIAKEESLPADSSNDLTTP